MEIHKAISSPDADVIAEIVRRQLEVVPNEHLVGLSSIVITGRDSLSPDRKVKAAGRLWREQDCLSFYHLATKKRRAYVELVAMMSRVRGKRGDGEREADDLMILHDFIHGTM